MKMELRIDGKTIVIEAEGVVSVKIIEEVEEKEVVKPLTVQEKEVSGDLFSRLVELRRELALSANVPPYVVFKDKTLQEMAEKRPADLTEFGNLGGVGAAKLEKYGAAFLAVINEGVAA